MVSVILKQTVARRGSLVFCISKKSKASPHSGREGEAPRAWLKEIEEIEGSAIDIGQEIKTDHYQTRRSSFVMPKNGLNLSPS